MARKLATAYSLPHLDTGLTYRAVAHTMLMNDGDLTNKSQVIEIARSVDLANLDRNILSDHAIGEVASKIAAIQEVRTILVEAQRNFSKQQPGAVLDGRDIGTVVCPNADLKLFVTASAEIRARRRSEEMTANGKPSIYAEIFADLTKRDLRDTGRKHSPLLAAKDAHLIDTSKMDIETRVPCCQSTRRRGNSCKELRLIEVQSNDCTFWCLIEHPQSQLAVQ